MSARASAISITVNFTLVKTNQLHMEAQVFDLAKLKAAYCKYIGAVSSPLCTKESL